MSGVVVVVVMMMIVVLPEVVVRSEFILLDIKNCGSQCLWLSELVVVLVTVAVSDVRSQ